MTDWITVNRRVLQKLAPIAVAYFALGVACGILGQKTGLNPWEAFAMSVLVFAGSGQFIGLAMLGQGAALASIAITIYIVNLRHLFFSTSLQPYLKQASKPFLWAFAHGITDETFAVNLNSYEREGDWTRGEAFGLNVTACLAWSLSNGLGCYASEYLNPPTALVSYVLIAMFLGIWSNYLQDKRLLITGVISGVLAIVLSRLVPYKLHIVLATLITSATACYYFHRLDPVPDLGQDSAAKGGEDHE